MNKVMNVSVRRRRTTLLGGVALGLLAPMSTAMAQTGPAAGTLPDLANAGGATVSTAGTAMSVNLNDASRTMEWNSFSVASDSSVAFSTADTGTGFTVLNRVTGGTLSEIYGRVTSQSNISVWLSNPNGIVYGSSGAFSGGSLVLTTAALTAVPTTGNATLGNMGSSAITIASNTANNGITGLNVTGSLIVAAQAIDVTGRISATGDVALVAARSVDVPVALGSNVRVTINEGTTVAQGRVVVGANGAIDAGGGIALAGAAGNATNFLLGIDSSATLSATAVGGRVILAAGASSTEATAGSNVVTVNPSASGAVTIDPSGAISTAGLVNVNSAGAITGTAATPGTIAGRSINIAAAGNVTLANAITAADGLTIASNGGTLSLGGSLTATAGGISLTGANALQLGTGGQTRSLLAGQSVQARAIAGGVSTSGNYVIESGRTNDTGGVTIEIGGGAGFALDGTSIRAGTEASAGVGYRGSVLLRSNSPSAVPLTLEAVDAAQLTVSGTLGAINFGRIGLAGDVALNAGGALRLDSATSLNGSIALNAVGEISGRAGAGGLLAGFGRTTLTAGTTGRTVTVQAGGIAQLGDLRAGTVGTGTASGATQMSVNAAAIDLLTARAATGNLALTATGAGAAGTIRAATLAAPLGNVAIAANGDVRGQTAAAVLGNGIRIGSARAGTIDIDTANHARVGTLDAAGDLTIDANGSVTGLSLAADVAAGPGIDITGGGTLTIGSTLAPAARVALGAVSLGATGGAVTIDAGGISAGAIDTAGTVTLRAASGLSVDALGANVRTGAATFRQTIALAGGEDGAAARWSTGATLSPAFGATLADATGTIAIAAGVAPLTAGAQGIAQLARANGTAVAISGEGVTLGTAASRAGVLSITARSGGLYVDAAAATGAATLTKGGTAGPVDADEVRVLTSLTAGGTTTLTSATDIRATQIATSAGNVAVQAARAVTGLRRGAVSGDGRLAAGYDRAAITAGAAGATVLVDALAGIAQLGDVVAGDTAGAVDAQANQLRVTGTGVDITGAAARNGNLVLTAGNAGLRLGTGSAAWGASGYDSLGGTYDAGIVSGGDAQIGTLTATGGDILIRVSGTLTALRTAAQPVPGVAAGLTVGDAVVGALTLGGTGDIVLGSGNVGSAAINASASARIGDLAATGTLGVTAGGSITGLGSIAAAAPGANLIATVGSVRLPTPAGAGTPTVAVLGNVRAGTAVALAAGQLSAQSIAAGATVDVAAGNTVVGSVNAATARLSGNGVIAADTNTLTVDGAGALRGGFGFANIATNGAGATITLTAGNAVQAGAIAAGAGSTLVPAVAGGNAQVRIDAAAISAQSVTARNGSLLLSAGAGDLYLGSPVLVDAVTPVGVASARDRAIVTKNGTAGRLTIAGTLQAGAGGIAGSGAGDDGVAQLTSATDIGARRIASATGDVRLSAAGVVGGLTAINAGSGGAGPVLGTAGEVTLGAVSLDGILSVSAGDIRIGSAQSATAIDLAAAGSVTGLATASGATGTGYHTLAVRADRAVSIGGVPAEALDVAAIGSIVAGSDVTVQAGAIAIGSVQAGGFTTLTGDAVRLDSATLTGGLTVRGGTATANSTPASYAADVWNIASEVLAGGYGAADLNVTNPGSTGGIAGTIAVNAGRVAQLGNVTAGAGAAPLRDGAGNPRDQLIVNASAVTLASATARNGAARLTASNGGLYAGAIAAGTAAIVTKSGAPGTIGDGDEMRIGALTAGTTGATGAARGDVSLSSSSAMRLGTVSSATGSVRIGDDTVPGAAIVTGLLRETASNGADGQMLPGYDGANLSAAASAALVGEPVQRVVVNVTGAAKLGSVLAGAGGDRITGANQLRLLSGALDVDRATARNGDLALTTTTGRLRLGTGVAAGDAALVAGSVAAASAQIGSLAATAGDLAVRATDGVTGWLDASVAPGMAAEGLRMVSVVAGRDVTITSAGNARLGEVTATGALSVGAARSVTGLPGAVDVAANAVTLLSAGGSVSVGGVATDGALALASIAEVQAGATASVGAGAIAVDRVVSGGATRLAAGTALAAGSLYAGGAVTATTAAAGAGDADNGVPTGGALAAGYGAANLTARTAGATTGIISVDAGNVAQLGAVIAGTAADDALIAVPQIAVTARAMRIGTAEAFGGAIDLAASEGDLGLGVAGSGAWIRLRKAGASGDIDVGALTSGTQPGSDGIMPAGVAGAPGWRGGATLIDSSTAIRGGAIRSLTGDILLRAVDGVTGRSGTAGVRGNFVIGVVDAESATLSSAGTMRIGQVRTTGALDASARGSITGLADGAGATGVMLTAARGVDVRGSGGVDLAMAALGDVTARASVTLETGAQLPDAVRIAAAQITAGTIDAGGGAATLQAGRAIDVSRVVAGVFSAATAQGDGAADPFVIGVADAAAGFDEEQLAAGFGDALLLARGPLRVTSAAGVAQLGRTTGSDATITAEGITLRSRDAAPDAALAVTGDATLTSRRGALYLESATVAGRATVTKAGAGDEMRVGALRATSIALDSATAIRLGAVEATGRRTDDVADIDLRAGTGAISGLNAVGGGSPFFAGSAADGRIDDGYGRAQLTASAEGARIVVTAAGLAQLGDVTAAGSVAAAGTAPQIAVTAGAIDVATRRGTDNADLRQALTAGAGGVSLTATGRLRAGVVDAATNIVATTQGSIEAARLTARTQDVRVAARDGRISGLSDLPGGAVPNDGRLLAGYGRADIGALAADRTVTVLAGTPDASTTANVVQLGAVIAGAGAAKNRVANQIDVRGGAVDIVSATATNANAVIDARVGAAAVGTLRAGGGVEEYLGTDTYAAGVRAAGTAQLGTVNAATGNVRITSANGDVAGLAFAPGIASATDGRLLPLFGRADVTAAAAGRRVLIQAANGGVQLGAVSAGQGAGTGAETTIDVSARAIDAVGATANNGALALTATQGGLWLGGGSAATNAVLTKQGGGDKMRIGAGGLTAGGNMTIASTTDLDTAAAIRSGAAAGVVRVTNTGTNATALGGAATTTGNNVFSLNEAEVNRLAAATIVLDSRANAMTLGTLTIGTNAAGNVPNTALRVLGTGAVDVVGAVTGNGTGRTVQIGGTDAALPTGGTLATPANLASSINLALDRGGSISWAGGTLALAGQRIVAGNAALRDVASGGSAGAISRLVSDPSSALYRGTGSNTPYLTAGTLSVTYRDYALFQNSGAGSASTFGAVLGSPSTPQSLALRLTALGDNGSDSFALFGAINGFVSSAAALQPETVIDFADGTPRTVRITLANARVNGCGIGVATAGCLAGTPPPPALSLFDERQIQLFGTDSNPELQFEPLIGTNNEGLIGDLATASVAAECPTGQDGACPAAQQEVKP